MLFETTVNPEQPLFDVAEKGDLESLKNFLKKGCDANATNDHGVTLLHLAAQGGHSEVIKFLIDNGADVNALTDDGWTALHFTGRQGFEESTKILLEKKIDPNTSGLRYERTALHYAAEQGHNEVVLALIKSGADLTSKDRNGDTALDLANKKGHLKTAELLQKGAS